MTLLYAYTCNNIMQNVTEVYMYVERFFLLFFIA